MRVAQRRRWSAGTVPRSSGKRSAVAAEVKGGWDRSPWERRDLPAGSRPGAAPPVQRPWASPGRVGACLPPPGPPVARPRLASGGRRAGSRPQLLEELGGAGGGRSCSDCSQGWGERTLIFTAQCHTWAGPAAPAWPCAPLSKRPAARPNNSRLALLVGEVSCLEGSLSSTKTLVLFSFRFPLFACVIQSKSCTCHLFLSALEREVKRWWMFWKVFWLNG